MRICPRCSELLPDDAVRCPRDGTELRPVVDPLLGRTVGGRYRLISRVGSGGMSSVYLARHVLIDRLMAIKTLRRDLAKDPVQRDRFLREARAVNRINHENIVEISDFGESDDGLVYLVMEYVPGESLLKVMNDGAMPGPRALHIVRQCAAALARAHQMGVIHRDLKPENILLVQRGGEPDFVKVLDFGIAKILDAPSLTGSQQIFGTPGYIAPEYIQSTHIDGRADIYSLGVILYEMVTGALPFDYEFPGDLLVKHVTEKPIAPSSRHPRVEKPVEELILRCLEKDPLDRFRDAFHLLEEIDRIAERLGPATSWGGMSEKPRLPDTQDEGLSSEEPRGRSTLVDAAPTPVREDELEVVEDESGRRPRVATAEYARPEIPGAPTLSSGEQRPDPPDARKAERDGLAGVRRWRRRFHALRAHLDDLELKRPSPPVIAHAMAFVSRTLDELETAVADAVAQQARLEELDERARDFRSTLGKAIDGLAGKLSFERASLEELGGRRGALTDRRDAVRKATRAGARREGDADALLWELAAVEAELRDNGARADDLEVRIAELRGELERRNEETEREAARTVQWLDGQMLRIDAMANALREPLERVETHVLASWPADMPDETSADPPPDDEAARPTPTSG